MNFKHPGNCKVAFVIVAKGEIFATADDLEKAQKIVKMKKMGRNGKEITNANNATNASRLDWQILPVD